MFEESEIIIDGVSGQNKSMLLCNKPNTTMFQVKWKSGGNLPLALEGQLWTSRKDATKAVQRWYESDMKKTKRGAA